MTGQIPAGLAEALQGALGGLELVDRDGAVVALALRYARDLDAAQVVSTQAAKLIRDLGRTDVDTDLVDRLEVLAARIEHTAVLGLLGPKLLAALAELGMTPRARAGLMRAGGGGADVSEHGERCRCLPCQRKRRALRRDRAAAVDPSSG